MTPGELLREAERVLAQAGVASPRYDAAALLDHVLGDPNARHLGRGVDAPAATAYRDLVARRARREPLQHLLGTAAFRTVTLAVGPGVFVPRPETESLVGWGLTTLAGRADPVVLDLCAGSGAIACAVAAEHPGARVYAVEAAPRALAWLRRNAADHPQVTVLAGDAAEPATTHGLDGGAALVLTNPPYVPEGTPVPPEVGHDPPEALWAGPDGLALLPGLVARAHALLRSGGWFGTEHAEHQGPAVAALLDARGFAAIATHPDLAGRPRYTVGMVTQR